MPYEPLLPSLRAIAEPTRLWMVRLLVEWAGPRTGPLRPGERGLCLTDIELAVGLPHPLVSHHLRILREAGVVESEKRGRWTVYRVRTESLARIARALAGLSTSSGPREHRAA